MAPGAVLGLEVHHLEDRPLGVVLVALVVEIVQDSGYVAVTSIPEAELALCPVVSISRLYSFVVILDVDALDPETYVLVRLWVLSKVVLCYPAAPREVMNCIIRVNNTNVAKSGAQLRYIALPGPDNAQWEPTPQGLNSKPFAALINRSMVNLLLNLLDRLVYVILRIVFLLAVFFFLVVLLYSLLLIIFVVIDAVVLIFTCVFLFRRFGGLCCLGGLLRDFSKFISLGIGVEEDVAAFLGLVVWSFI